MHVGWYGTIPPHHTIYYQTKHSSKHSSSLFTTTTSMTQGNKVTDLRKAVVKAAKKALQKETSPLKLVDLTARIAQAVGTDHLEAVSDALKASSKVVIDEKHIVTWRRKSKDNNNKNKKKRGRCSSDNVNDVNNDNDQANHAKTTASKKAKRNNNNSSIDDWRLQHKIVVRSTDDTDQALRTDQQRLHANPAYFPYTTFDACRPALDDALLQHCTAVHKFTTPSPVQAQAWPLLVAQRDVVGIAETGSGKTLAFGLPALSHMKHASNHDRHGHPRMLVLSPTRELAMQSNAVLQDFGAVVGLQALVVYGGVPKYPQVAALQRGRIDCLVATPGRLTDLCHDGAVDLSHVQYLVLDEADRMLDLGFAPQVRAIVEQCRTRQDGRQTAMFSATWPAAVQKIALDYMTDPVRVYVGFEAIVGSAGDGGGAVDDSLSANKRVTQNVEVLDDHQREDRLRQILKKVHGKRDNRVLVFALYKKEADRLERSLQRAGWHCCSIHGNKTQQARTAALADFKAGTCPLLIATDVAARGLDIPNVEVVINYTFPLTIEDYVHRIGRTGRAGQTGVSYTFFQPGDKSHAGELQQVMKQAGQAVPDALMKFGSTIKKKEHKLYGNFGPREGQPMKKATKIVFHHSDDDES